jgi:hypothetical protein
MVEIVYMSMSSNGHRSEDKIVQLLKIIVAPYYRLQGHGRRTLAWALKHMFRTRAACALIFSPASKGVACDCCCN